MSKSHFMSWACQDWLSSPLRGELAMEKDHLTRMVYRDLLDVLHEKGGYVLRSEVAGACLVTPKEATRAVDRLVKSGRIQEENGRLSNIRVLEGLAIREAYVQAKADAGKKSAKVRKNRTGTAQPPNKHRTSVQQSPNTTSTPSEPSFTFTSSVPSPLPLPNNGLQNAPDGTLTFPSQKAADLFLKHYPEGKPSGAMFKALRPLVREYGWEKVGPEMEAYLQGTEVTFHSWPKFASGFGSWSKGRSSVPSKAQLRADSARAWVTGGLRGDGSVEVLSERSGLDSGDGKVVLGLPKPR